MDIWVIYLCCLGLQTFLGFEEQLAGTNRATFVDLSENVPATSKSVEVIGQD